MDRALYKSQGLLILRFSTIISAIQPGYVKILNVINTKPFKPSKNLQINTLVQKRKLQNNVSDNSSQLYNWHFDH